MGSAVDAPTVGSLLDRKAVEGMLRQVKTLSRLEWRQPQRISVWVKPGRYFNAAYRLAGAPRLLTPGKAAALFALGVPAALRARRRMRHGDHDPTMLVSDCARCSSVVTARGVLVQLFPFDYRLPTLAHCQEPTAVAREIGAAVERIHPTTYRAGMRCQIAYGLADGSEVFGKVAVEREPGGSFRKQRALFEALGKDRGDLAVASPRCYSEALQMSVVEAVDGEPLDRIEQMEHALPRVARALARFHSLDAVPSNRTHRIAEELILLRGWVPLIAKLFPELAPRLEAGLEVLLREAPGAAGERCLVHRDFFGKQVLVSDRHVSLIDLDTAAGGEREIDLANFCAHLRLRFLQGKLRVDDRDLSELFLANYPRGFSLARLEWYRRAALLRLGCVYALRDRWLGIVPALLEEARTGAPIDVSVEA